MFTTSTYLSTRRPSSTTVAYTVSNSVLYKTLSSRIFLYLTIFFRVSLCIITVAILATKAFFHYEISNPLVNGYHDVSGANGQPLLIERVALSSPWSVVGPIALVVLFLCLRRFHTGKISLTILISALTGSDTLAHRRVPIGTSFTRNSNLHDI